MFTTNILVANRVDETNLRIVTQMLLMRAKMKNMNVLSNTKNSE